MATTTMGVKLDEELRKRLKTLGELKQRSPHWLMKKAIQEYLAREEAYEREKREDGERWQRYQETGEYISNEAMMSWLDTWGTDKEGECPKPGA